jgi:hypothetical protein
MLNINFDLFYELKQGSIVSNTKEEAITYWRIVDGNLEAKYTINNESKYDWQVVDLFLFPVDGKFAIEERFERFKND